MLVLGLNGLEGVFQTKLLHPAGGTYSKKQRKKSVAPSRPWVHQLFTGKAQGHRLQKRVQEVMGWLHNFSVPTVKCIPEKKLLEVWCVLYAHQNQIAL